MLTSTNQLKNLLFLFIFTFQTLWYTQASTWGKNPIFWQTSSYINGLCLSFLIIIPTRLPASVQTRSVITPGNTQNITSCEASIAKLMTFFILRSMKLVERINRNRLICMRNSLVFESKSKFKVCLALVEVPRQRPQHYTCPSCLPMPTVTSHGLKI